MGDNGAQQKQRHIQREQKREERKAQGMADEEIAKLEAEEDAQAEQEAVEKSTGYTLQDLEVCKHVLNALVSVSEPGVNRESFCV